MISNLLIALAELRKLGLLYLAIKYDLHAPAILIGYWLIWQLFSAILLGNLSDKVGRKPVLYLTVFFSILVSLLAREKGLFSLALFIDGFFVATLPITFAAKNDQHPTKNKRLTYAEASLARAIPWLIFPLIYLWQGMPKQFWEISLLTSGLLSAALLIIFKDTEDSRCETENNKTNKSPRIFCAFVVIFLTAFFLSECSYQTVPYLAEAKEPISELMKSYLLFGLGMSITCSLQLCITKFLKLDLGLICSITFLFLFIYFSVNFLFYNIQQAPKIQNILSKLVLGMASGIYIPFIYAIICKRFRKHQQGFLCGLIDATGTFAEILAPGLAYLLFTLGAPLDKTLLITGFGFLLSYVILMLYRQIKKIYIYEKNS